MYVPFLLFVITIVLISIFWELSMIHALLKKRPSAALADVPKEAKLTRA
jgi:hypothetical protein